jgi:outer membrane protein assembly factor BamB
MKSLFSAALFFSLIAAAAAQLVGINYNNSSQHNQYLCINPATGATTVLNCFDYDSGFWYPNSLTTDVSTSSAYAVSSAGTLYTFNLTTGNIQGAVPLGISVIRPGLNGTLIGIKNTSSGLFEFHSIDPATGSSTALSSFTMSAGYFANSFVTDLKTGPAGGQGTAYLLSGDHKLYTFNVTTGALLGTPQLSATVGGIGVGVNGNLIGIQRAPMSAQWELHSIDPTAGSSTKLSSFDLPGGFSTLKSDPSKNVVYVISGNTLYSFNLSNGSPVASSTLAMPVQATAIGAGGPCPTAAGPCNAGPPQLLNISTRARVETGDNVLIGGFIIAGNAPKNVIIRAIGASLTDFGIPDALLDPQLELYGSNGNLIAKNDDWQKSEDPNVSDQSQASAVQLTNIPPGNPQESALVVTLTPANYSAIVRGKNNSTGVGLVEVYDLNPSSGSEFANISTRGRVQTHDDVMIGGFILGGKNGIATVVVRAIGPTLGQSGVTNFLADPVIDLRDSNAMTVRGNDDWETDSEAGFIQLKKLAPKFPSESATAATLPPGAYTVIVSGKNGGTGIGLVEVYNLH